MNYFSTLCNSSTTPYLQALESQEVLKNQKFLLKFHANSFGGRI